MSSIRFDIRVGFIDVEDYTSLLNNSSGNQYALRLESSKVEVLPIKEFFDKKKYISSIVIFIRVVPYELVTNPDTNQVEARIIDGNITYYVGNEKLTLNTITAKSLLRDDVFFDRVGVNSDVRAIQFLFQPDENGLFFGKGREAAFFINPTTESPKIRSTPVLVFPDDRTLQFVARLRPMASDNFVDKVGLSFSVIDRSEYDLGEPENIDRAVLTLSSDWINVLTQSLRVNVREWDRETEKNNSLVFEVTADIESDSRFFVYLKDTTIFKRGFFIQKLFNNFPIVQVSGLFRTGVVNFSTNFFEDRLEHVLSIPKIFLSIEQNDIPRDRNVSPFLVHESIVWIGGECVFSIFKAFRVSHPFSISTAIEMGITVLAPEQPPLTEEEASIIYNYYMSSPLILQTLPLPDWFWRFFISYYFVKFLYPLLSYSQPAPPEQRRFIFNSVRTRTWLHVQSIIKNPTLYDDINFETLSSNLTSNNLSIRLKPVFHVFSFGDIHILDKEIERYEVNNFHLDINRGISGDLASKRQTLYDKLAPRFFSQALFYPNRENLASYEGLMAQTAFEYPNPVFEVISPLLVHVKNISMELRDIQSSRIVNKKGLLLTVNRDNSYFSKSNSNFPTYSFSYQIEKHFTRYFLRIELLRICSHNGSSAYSTLLNAASDRMTNDILCNNILIGVLTPAASPYISSYLRNYVRTFRNDFSFPTTTKIIDFSDNYLQDDASGIQDVENLIFRPIFDLRNGNTVYGCNLPEVMRFPLNITFLLRVKLYDRVNPQQEQYIIKVLRGKIYASMSFGTILRHHAILLSPFFRMTVGFTQNSYYIYDFDGTTFELLNNSDSLFTFLSRERYLDAITYAHLFDTSVSSELFVNSLNALVFNNIVGFPEDERFFIYIPNYQYIQDLEDITTPSTIYREEDIRTFGNYGQNDTIPSPTDDDPLLCATRNDVRYLEFLKKIPLRSVPMANFYIEGLMTWSTEKNYNSDIFKEDPPSNTGLFNVRLRDEFFAPRKTYTPFDNLNRTSYNNNSPTY